MNVTIQPSSITGSIVAAASKSSMQRACAAALLHHGTTIIHNPGHSNDDNAAIDVIQQMGAKTSLVGEELHVTSNGVNAENERINCGESGLGIRMFAPIISMNKVPITINGEGSLLKRPMDFFDEVLPDLGIQVKSNDGKLPLVVKGPLQTKEITIDGSLSSQFLTGLLFAYSASVTEPTTINVTNLKSKPYIDLTLKVLAHFGYKIENRNYEQFIISPSNNSEPTTINYTVEGDWSGAAFLLVAGAIAGKITVKGLDVFSTQADKAILQALADSKASLSIQESQIEIGPGALQAFHFDATECPDLFPPLVALASYCAGKTVIEGANRLTHKESNRALTLQEEFGKMGIQIDLQDDLMIVHGGTGVKGAIVHSHHDHRIAMACAVAGLKANGETTIEVAEAINKSYPDFYEHIKKLGTMVLEAEVSKK
ncbi:3-phosphoshikimate 1-carboxyvinyltransferase [Pinibacter aurantiacus]|uniref:3-phosphoshikimate 1-carboxyvinyltransferase n=1 Tax=Pinibacter aurantiacus TaxID=2851599 RepID=A0A9E2SBM9_9BACT|nr:3-phosphoshikimate 1-carboxyvinyltransferase [Pinibacter aurantiacus]MBV4358524.1 3-phosphoshikimate 1-carboxyvinyltransferase [Pinibacter aurantiacus]